MVSLETWGERVTVLYQILHCFMFIIYFEWIVAGMHIQRKQERISMRKVFHWQPVLRRQRESWWASWRGRKGKQQALQIMFSGLLEKMKRTKENDRSLLWHGQFACINMLICFCHLLCFICKMAPREEKITIIYHRRPWEKLAVAGLNCCLWFNQKSRHTFKRFHSLTTGFCNTLEGNRTDGENWCWCFRCYMM